MEAEHPVQQAFGSPGGKSYLAPRIAGMIPPHRVYVEPFAGGAAVYFRKEPSEKEVLGDKDTEIAFAFKFLRGMTPVQFKWLQKQNWQGSEKTFRRLKTMKPRNDLERFYRFYYLKKASFGDGSNTYNYMKDGKTLGTDLLWKVHERLKRTKTHSGQDALKLIDRYDSSNTFFYLDPPYPNRAFIGATDKYTTEDLARLVSTLKGVKGKFALSLGTEHEKLLPKNWYIRRMKV